MGSLTQWAKMIASGVCLCLLAATGQADSRFSDPREQYRHLMPQGADFPGTVAEDAERISRSFRFSQHPRDFADLRLRFPPRNRKSTGLYRVPNEPLVITVRPVDGYGALSPEQAGLQLVVGAHKSFPAGARVEGHRRRWPQAPFILTQGEQTDAVEKTDGGLATGLVYLQASRAGTGSFDITITGAVRAPWFKLGRDSLTHWQEVLRHDPGPWAELEGEHAILTVPSAMIRDLEDPEPVIRFYDQLVQSVHVLVGLDTGARDTRDLAPDLPFRFVLDPALIDRSPRLWWASAGYLIELNWLGFGHPYRWLEPDNAVVAAIVMHELGHNHEPVDRAFEPPGAGEAFADLINYADQSRKGYICVAKRLSWGDFCSDLSFSLTASLGHLVLFIDNLFMPGIYEPRIWVEDKEAGKLQKRAFMLKLVRHLSHEFVPGLYSRFRHTPQEALPDPDNQQQKTDFFFELLCEVTGQDLTPLFQDWYVPVSDQAYQRVADKGYDIPPWVRHDGL